MAEEEASLPLSEPRMFTVDNYFLKVHIFCIVMFMINVVAVVLCVHTCIFLQDMYKCWWNIAFICKDLPAGAWVLGMPITPELNAENSIMKPENHRSINTAAYAHKASGLQGEA